MDMVFDNVTIEQVRRALELPGEPASRRVVVAMSGGVDSSVAAALVKQAGYETLGITLQLYDHGAAVARSRSCCAGQDIHDARRVAARLDMPHYVLDFESRFRDSVIDDFADSYLRGETPIPCVRCNQTVKFADLMARARALGADALVTGHYVGSRVAGRDGRREMVTPADMDRDQSYFLFATTQAQLDLLRFPLAGFSKPEIRDMAGRLGLGVAAKPDSQDICFVPDGDYAALIERLRPAAVTPGDIVDEAGRVVGRHDGIIHYTIGQRRGLGIAAAEPLYVVRLDPALNQVVVGPRASLGRDRLWLKDFNWIGDGDPGALEVLEVFAKVRSTRPARAAFLRFEEDSAVIDFAVGEDGVSPGQACVLYDGLGPGARVLGGGFIARTEDASARPARPARVHRVYQAASAAR